MKDSKFYLLAVSFLGIGILLGAFFSRKFSFSTVSQEVQVMTMNQMMTDKKIQEDNSRNGYKINVYYPYTAYANLNLEIEKFVQEEVREFKKGISSSPILENQYYMLDITYDTYQYEDYISYVFKIFMDTLGAHPNTYYHTISYDKKKKELITIAILAENHKDLLTTLSKESRMELMKNKKFQVENFKDIEGMLLEGTKPTKENFRNFAFSENGFLVFFENYQVAPYYLGSFQVTIPYSKIFPA